MDAFEVLLAVCVGIIAILIVLLLGSELYKPIVEARHYKNITGIEVTYWDAFYLDLDPSKHVVMIEND